MADRYWVAGGTGNYNSTTNWSASSGGASGASVPTTADNVFFNASSGVGTATINTSSVCANLNLTGFTGTLQFNNNLQLGGTSLNLGTGGYIVSYTGTFGITLGSTITVTSNGTTWAGTISLGNTTVTLADNLTVSGAWQYTSSGTATVNGNTLFISGNLTHTSTTLATGTTAFVFNGTGTWSHTSTGILRNNVTINTAGTITLGTNVYYNTGTLTYIAGTVVTTGSTLNISASTTLNTNGITWNNITAGTSGVVATLSSNLTLTGTLSLGASSTLAFTLGGNSLISTNANLTMGSSSLFTMPANQTFKTLTISGGGIGATITGNTLTITENIVMNQQVSGTTNIVYGGTGTWTASGSANFINNNFTINTAGTLTISGTVYKSNNTFTYTAGTVVDTGSTVVVGTGGNTTLNVSGKTWDKLLVNSVTTLTSNINAITFGTIGSNSTSFTLGGNSINFTHLELGAGSTTTLPSAWSCQNLTIAVGSGSILNGFSITVNGDILQSGGGYYSGSTTFTYAGTGTWTTTSTTGHLTNTFTINTAGTLTINSAAIGGGIFTYTAGTVITTGSTLYIRQFGTTMNHGAIVWNNVMLGINNTLGQGGITSITLNNQLVCLGALRLNVAVTTFSGTNGTFDVYNLLFGMDTAASRTTTLASTKTYRVRQSFVCTQATAANRVILKSSVGSSQAIFTVDQGAAIDVGFVDATDINSSLGRRIYSYRGVFSNTLNWALLPTDVKPATGVFVN